MTQRYNHCKTRMTVVGFEPTNPLGRDSGSQSRRVCQFRHTVARLLVDGDGPETVDSRPGPSCFPRPCTLAHAASGNSSLGNQWSPRLRIFSAKRSRLRQVLTVRSRILPFTNCAASTICTPVIPGVALMHCSTTIMAAEGGLPRRGPCGFSEFVGRSRSADSATAAMASRQPLSYARCSASAIRRSISCLGSGSGTARIVCSNVRTMKHS